MSCDNCERMGQLDEIPLHTQILVEPFEKLALKFWAIQSTIKENGIYLGIYQLCD
jgi:hypothetical protein